MIAQALTEKVIQHAQLAYGWNKPPRVTGRAEFDCPYSQVTRLELTCDQSSRVVYLKCLKPTGMDLDQARRRPVSELNILNQLFAHFKSSPQWRTPRPIAAFPEHYAVLMEAVPGTDLMTTIARHGRRYSRARNQSTLDKYCLSAGRWLREFQTITSKGSGDFNIVGLIEYCALRLETLSNDINAIDDQFNRRFVSFLDSRYRRLTCADRVVVGRHNDFAPHHILVDGNRISVIDFGLFDHDSRHYDVCRFWFQLERLQFNPLFSRSLIRRLQDRFFEGYGESLDQGSPAFEMAASRYFLSHLAGAAENCRRGLRRWVDRRTYDWCLNWLRERCL